MCSLRRAAADPARTARCIDGFLAGVGRRLLSPRVFVPALLSYLLVLFVIRGMLISGGPNDDSEQLLYSQFFAWGYGLRNPPLYTWLVIGAQQLLGVSLATVTAVKFALLAATYLILLASARHMAKDGNWATAAAAAPLGVYYVAWDAVQNYSGTVLLMCICAATHHCLLRIAGRRHVAWHGALGLAVGAGILTKYNYLLFAISLFAAALIDGGFRRRLVDPRILLTLMPAALVVAPYAVYVATHAGGDTAGMPSGTLARTAGLPPWAALTAGLGHFVSLAVSFFSPFPFLAPLFFRRALGRMRAGAAHVPAIRMTGLSLLIQAVLFLVMFVVAYARGVGVPLLHAHLLFSFILLPLWFVSCASHAQASLEAAARFAAALTVLAVAVAVLTAGKLVLDPLMTGRPMYNVPYRALAEALRQQGFTHGTVYTRDYPFPLSGNLRVWLPDSRFITDKFPFFIPPGRATAGQCLALWTSDGSSDADRLAAVGFRVMTGADMPLDHDPSLVTLPFSPGWGRAITFRYRLFPAGVGSCR